MLWHSSTNAVVMLHLLVKVVTMLYFQKVFCSNFSLLLGIMALKLGYCIPRNKILNSEPRPHLMGGPGAWLGNNTLIVTLSVSLAVKVTAVTVTQMLFRNDAQIYSLSHLDT